MHNVSCILIWMLTVVSQLAIGSEMDSSAGTADQWKLLEVKPKESEEIWFFRKNMRAARDENKDRFATLVYFTVGYTPRDSSGLPSRKDADTLYAFEEQVIPKLEKEANCILVASVVKGGIKDHLFYVSDPERFLSSVRKYKNRLGNLSVSLEKSNDPKWKIYADFPGDT